MTSRKPPWLPAGVLVRARHSEMRAACRERTAKLMLQLPSWATAARVGPAPAEVVCVQGCSVADERCGRAVVQGGVQGCGSCPSGSQPNPPLVAAWDLWMCYRPRLVQQYSRCSLRQ